MSSGAKTLSSPGGGHRSPPPNLWDRFIALLQIPTPEAEQLLRRITTMERDIILPLKAAVIGMLLYSFYNRPWIRHAMEELSIAVDEWTGYFVRYYIPGNVLVAAVLLRIRRLPLGLVQWTVFVSGLMDGIFLSALMVVTGGYQSFVFWIFLALIVRTAVSVPRATSQLALNLTLIACYFMAGIINIQIATSLEGKFGPTLNYEALGHRTNSAARGITNSPRLRSGTNAAAATLTRTNAPSHTEHEPMVDVNIRNPEDSWREVLWLEGPESLVVRLVLLLLMSVCCYGVQVLMERQRRAVEEAREFAMREGQLHSAGRLAAEFAHQMKNPLAIINNAAFSLQNAIKQGRTNIGEQLQIIQEEVERSDRIITQIMGYAQLSEGRVEKLNVVEELDRAIERVFPPAVEYPVVVHRDYGGAFPPLMMQRGHLVESFVNLLQNAREALGPKGGNVYITARCESDYSVVVEIEDDGPGIPADRQLRVFEAYYTTKEKGTGLGLATVKHNVEIYSGSVRLESELGKGARFILSFPSRTLLKLSG